MPARPGRCRRRPDLLLTTGNAGGTEMLVDGVATPLARRRRRGAPRPAAGSGPDQGRQAGAGAAHGAARRPAAATGSAAAPAAEQPPSHGNRSRRRGAGHRRGPAFAGGAAAAITGGIRMSYRPYQDINRRKSRQIYVGKVPVGGDAPITVQTMTNTLTTDVDGTVAQIRRAEEAGVDIVRVSCPDQESAAGAEGHRARRSTCRSSPTSISTTSAPSRRPRAAPPACASIPAISAAPSGCGGGQGRQRPRLLHAHRRQCRLAGEAPAGEIRRAEPRSDGRKRAGPRQDPAGPRFPRVQDQREGVRRVPGRRRLSATGRGRATTRCISASPRPAACARARSSPRSAWARCCGPASATPSASRCPPSRRKRSASASTC